MTSSVPLHIVADNDDEFDWEAAVREIDVACQNANPCSASSSAVTSLPVYSSSDFAPPAPHSNPIPSASSLGNNKNDDEKKRHATVCKQWTLDRFIGNSKIEVETADRRRRRRPDGDVDDVESDERAANCVGIDAEAAKTWIYPVNVPLRDYQLAISKTALFSNTLVALPTGLGKTLIAAVVMYNYFRWFPEGKIVFAAPSRPLVMQQIEACHNIVGIPQEWTIDMTGQITPSRRACFWKTKRVFFVTPQVLEKDIQSGTCLVRYLVCLVIDEAHRASGNYSYCVAVRELMAASLQLRILALTATPGSKQPAIQNIIDNLHISTLEYRNESDPDVSPYVQNRKIELIEVAMGRDAVDINQRLLEVIRPYVARLYAIGVLQNRDYQTLSPPDLLNSRDRFRRAPPSDLPQNKYGEIEAYFGGLITLYHIRKLLSSHGIKPAYEMLEEKLKQGPFARLMSKNEDIRKVKLLMQQSLSHGAPSPKLSKMLEILIEHLRTKDPQNSRVIIFSNFRGSVRDIMHVLANVGDLVRATEFIGQSSGKALKGQSQRVQQAVLQKFRAGGYNVIVATSIGEEGLDIMEVDLVICFDANVSPLRMIQRMGRTGRKHDGRVVVLACEGSELKGYMRKQANSRAIKKHMHNGGINSFNFHSSPRMIPHIFKPEVQFVEMSIDRFIPRGKKVKDDTAIQTPVFKEKLTVAETALIAKYFQHTIGGAWRPSLIAFPHFQALPSRVHKVMHSHRTDMLIDAMQHLQGLLFAKDSGTFTVQDEVHSGGCLLVNITGKEDKSEDSLIWDDSPSAHSQKIAATSEVSTVRIVTNENKNKVPDLGGQIRPTHSFFFGSDFVGVDAVGKVLILSVPLFPSKELSNSKCTSPSITRVENGLRHNFDHLENSGKNLGEATMQLKDALDITTIQRPLNNYVSMAVSMISSPNVYREKPTDWVGAIPETPILNRNQLNGADCHSEAFDPLEIKAPWVQDDEYSKNLGDSELSPRLTNMIQIGVVPESPIRDGGPNNKITLSPAPKLVQPEEFRPKVLLTPLRISGTPVDGSPCQRNAKVSLAYEEIQTPLLKVKDSIENVGCTLISPMADDNNSPMPNSMRNSCSRDWVLSSGGKSESAKPARKLKRLRKLGDIGKNKNLKSLKENSSAPIATLERPPITFPKQSKQRKGKRKQVDNVRVFIDEEAEVSSDAEISGDEEEDQEKTVYDSLIDSFIDDWINPTAASTQAEASKVDMMAVYRRSLLSQSPMEKESSASATITPDCCHVNRTDESRSSSVKTSYSFQTPQTESTNQSARQDSDSLQMNSERISAGICSATTDFPRKKETNMEVRKRKLSFCQSGPIPPINLEKEFSLQLKVSGRDSFEQGARNQSGANGEVYHDDQFFEGLDLDAVEAYAALLLKNRSDMPIQKQDTIPQSYVQNVDLHSSPSFDLGI